MIITMFYACSTKVNKENEQLKSRISVLEKENIKLKNEIALYKEDRALIRKYLDRFEQPGYWAIQYDSKTNEERPVLIKTFNKDANVATLIENEINKNHPPPYSPGIKFEKIEDKIVYIRILNGDMFTQRMGTSGAEGYAAMITFSFTSINDVSHVYLYGFEEGDHAAPGCFSRFDFLQFFGLIREKNEKDTQQ
jgi:hypothetical protein